MDISLLKILFDTGMFILIWIVQLVIYPSFNYYNEGNLKKWHKVYTTRISVVVLPLMLGQLFLYVYSAFMLGTIVNYVLLILVVITWVVTFTIAVPLHSKIESQQNTVDYRKRLVKTNWIRTGLWSIILIISLVKYGM